MPFEDIRKIISNSSYIAIVDGDQVFDYNDDLFMVKSNGENIVYFVLKDSKFRSSVKSDSFLYLYNSWHRTDGPAYIDLDSNYVRWYLHDEWMSFNDWLSMVEIDDKEKTKLVLRYGHL